MESLSFTPKIMVITLTRDFRIIETLIIFDNLDERSIQSLCNIYRDIVLILINRKNILCFACNRRYLNLSKGMRTTKQCSIYILLYCFKAKYRHYSNHETFLKREFNFEFDNDNTILPQTC